MVAVLMAAKCVSLDSGRAAGSGETTQLHCSLTLQQCNYMGVTEGKKNSLQIEIKSQTEAEGSRLHSLHFHPPINHHLRAGLKRHFKEAACTPLW